MSIDCKRELFVCFCGHHAGSICETFIDSDTKTIFGPFDAGFSVVQSAQFFGCVNTVLSSGIDTRTELMRVRHLGSIGVCDADPQIFDECGGRFGLLAHSHQRLL